MASTFSVEAPIVLYGLYPFAGDRSRYVTANILIPFGEAKLDVAVSFYVQDGDLYLRTSDVALTSTRSGATNGALGEAYNLTAAVIGPWTDPTTTVLVKLDIVSDQYRLYINGVQKSFTTRVNTPGGIGADAWGSVTGYTPQGPATVYFTAVESGTPATLSFYYGPIVSTLTSFTAFGGSFWLNNQTGPVIERERKYATTGVWTSPVDVSGSGTAKNTFANAERLGSDPVASGNSGSGTATLNTSATRESGEPRHGSQSVLTANSSLWWKITTPAGTSFGLNLTTTGSVTSGSAPFPTVIGVYTGYDVDGLVRITGGNSDSVSTGIFASLSPKTTYYIAVDCVASPNGTVHLNWSIT